MSASTPPAPQKHALSQLRWALGVLVLGICLLQGYRVLHDPAHRFSPDSLNYIDVARNITRGKGIVQSVVGYNEPRFNPAFEMPMPMVSQPPLYPIAVAALGGLGVPFPQAALAVTLLGMPLVIGGAYLLAREANGPEFGEAAAALTVVGLLVLAPLYVMTHRAWSETLASGFSLLGMALTLHARRLDTPSNLLLASAGLLCGLAFATRYVFLPLIPLCAVMLVAFSEPLLRGDRAALRESARRVLIFLAGAAILTAPVIMRNLILSGTLLGAERNPSLISLGTNLYNLYISLLGRWLDDPYYWPVLHKLLGVEQSIDFEAQAVVAMAIIVLIGVAASLRNVLSDALFHPQRILLTLWAALYLVTLVWQRTTYHFDPINPRLVFGAYAVMVALGAGIVARTIRLGPAAALVFAILVALFGFDRAAVQAAADSREPYRSEMVAVDEMPPLRWVAENTTARDLIIGDDTVDVVAYLDRPGAVSFSPYPYTTHFTHADLTAVLERHCPNFERAFLVLHGSQAGGIAWAAEFGPFIHSLVEGDISGVPEVVSQTPLEQGMVFALLCP